jgi:hypothetical protein
MGRIENRVPVIRQEDLGTEQEHVFPAAFVDHPGQAGKFRRQENPAPKTGNREKTGGNPGTYVAVPPVPGFPGFPNGKRVDGHVLVVRPLFEYPA